MAIGLLARISLHHFTVSLQVLQVGLPCSPSPFGALDEHHIVGKEPHFTSTLLSDETSHVGGTPAAVKTARREDLSDQILRYRLQSSDRTACEDMSAPDRITSHHGDDGFGTGSYHALKIEHI